MSAPPANVSVAGAAAETSPPGSPGERRDAQYGSAQTGNSSAPTSPGRLNPDVKAFVIPSGQYASQSAPTSPDRATSYAAGFGLRDRLLRHLSYYFSFENLMKDTFLISHMNPEYYVPCTLIANFPAVQKLTTDLDLVVELLKTCGNVQVSRDGTLVRPLELPPQAYAVPVAGSTTSFLPPVASVVFGEVVSEATEEEIFGLLDGTAVPLVVAKNESGVWMAKYPSEEVAKNVAKHVAQAQFKDSAVSAEVQVDSGRSQFPLPGYDPRLQQYYGGVYPYGYVPPALPVYGFPQFVFDGSMQGFRPPNQPGVYAGGRFPGNAVGGPRRGGSKSARGGRSNSAEFLRPQSVGRDRHASSGDEAGGSSKMSRRTSERGEVFGGGRREVSKVGKKSKSTGSDGGRRSETRRKHSEPAPELAPENFPALPGGVVPKPTDAEPAPNGAPTSAAWKSGNGSSVIPMAAIVKGLAPNKEAAPQKAATPTSMPTDVDPVAVQAERELASKPNSRPASGDTPVAAAVSEAAALNSADATPNDNEGGDITSADVVARKAGSGGPKRRSPPTAAGTVARGSGSDVTVTPRAPNAVPWGPLAARSTAPAPDVKKEGTTSAPPSAQSAKVKSAPWGQPADGGKPSFAEMLKRQQEGKE